MTNANYAILSRQFGLMRELTSVANNIANTDTAGFRREAVMFSEYIQLLGADNPSMSQTNLAGRFLDPRSGPISETGSPFDVAIEGEGFFMVEAPQGQRLTRAGSFTMNTDGQLSTQEGFPVLSEGGGPIAIPPGGGDVVIARDGTVSIDGGQVARIGVFTAPATSLAREGLNLLRTDAEPEPLIDARLQQGFIEESNVDPVGELARLIEVQRAYELGQQLLNDEDERVKKAIQAVGRSQG